MIVETRAKSVPVGFLDPELMSMSTMDQDRSYVVEYLGKALHKFARKKTYNVCTYTSDHWILVVIIPKWNKALYFYSERSKVRDYSVLKEVINEWVLP